MLPKPEGCFGCALERIGRGFVPPTGPAAAPVLFLAEAPGAREAIEGEPLKGDAGAVFNRAITALGKKRADFRLHNALSCQPPENALRGAHYMEGALAHCQRYLDPVLNEGHQVVVAMGATAIEALLPVVRPRVEDFHGTIQRDRSDRFWVIPTFHPSHINRGAWNLYRTFQWDLQVAFDLADEIRATGGVKLDSDDWLLTVDPSPEEFARWVDAILACPPEEVWLAADIETSDKAHKQDEGELGAKDRSWQILRINFSVREDEGLTVPWTGPYLPHIARLLAFPCVKGWWNAKYDLPRIRRAGMHSAGHQLDFMWAWHYLQSDVPKGLGFVSPFYIKAAAWKHLSGSEPGLYAAQDAIRTRRLMTAITEDLQEKGMWDVFWNHLVMLEEHVIQPSEAIGLPMSEEKLVELGEKLTKTYGELRLSLGAAVPEKVRPWLPKGGWKQDPGPEKTIRIKVDAEEEEKTFPVVKRQLEAFVNLCQACGATGRITKKHRCKDKTLVPAVVAEKRYVDRWFVRPEFNPRSRLQLLDLFHTWQLKVPLKKNNHGEKVETTDKLAIAEMQKRCKDSGQRAWFGDLQNFRLVDKVKGTYVVASLRRLKEDRDEGLYDPFLGPRLRPTVTHNPSTLRTSYTSPNLQNLKADRGGKAALEAGFRDCIVAKEGCTLLCPDFSGIEAVITGWLAGDKDYVRLAQLGVHAYATAKKMGIDVPLDRPDAEVAAQLAEVKELYGEKSENNVYDPMKRTIHGGNYGLTPHGMHDRMPAMFPTVAKAKEFYDFINKLFPSIAGFRAKMQDLAYRQHYLGGAGQHPFNYVHWFWNVYSYRRITPQNAVYRERKKLPWTKIGDVYYSIDLGDDAKRTIAFMPQSIAAGVIKEAALRLFVPGMPNYIGDVFYGRTPLRAIVHDDMWLEVPDAALDEVKKKVWTEMTRPVKQLPLPAEWGMGEYLAFGVEMKIGKDLGHLKKDKFHGERVLAADLGDLIDANEEEYDWEDELYGISSGAVPYDERASSGSSYAADADIPF